MTMQRFVGKDMKSALILIKEKIGDEALILGDRAIPGGVEILVDVPRDNRLKTNVSSKKNISTQNSKVNSLPANHNNDHAISDSTQKIYKATASKKDKNLSDKKNVSDDVASKQELETLRNDFRLFVSAMKAQIKAISTNEPVEKKSIHHKIIKRLEEKGFSHELIDAIEKDIYSIHSAQKIWKHCIISLTQRLKTIRMDPVKDVHIFLGPTGAGKTTTIAKLATKTVMEYGPDSVALLSTDRFRMGAVDQLRALSMALGVSIGIIDEKRPLKYWMKMFSQKRLVLVDTAGIHPGSKQWDNHIKRLSPYLNENHQQPVYGHLVLPAISQKEFIQHSIENYRNIKLTSVILTKIDEAILTAPVLSCLMQGELPISWFCDGQAVPNDIHHAKSHVLIAKALNHILVSPKTDSSWSTLENNPVNGRMMEST